MKNIPNRLPDSELVEQFYVEGNMQVLADLYQKYMDLVYGVSLKYMKDPEEAKDCVICIFEELVTKLRKHKVDNFKGWLYQLTRNHCLMRLRKIKGLPAHVDPDLVHLEDNQHLDKVIQKEENLDLMEDCLGKLIKEQREAVELFYLKEKCYKEIAKITGAEVGKIRSFIQNGRRNLKLCMENKIGENAL